MTRKEVTNFRCLDFSKWVRENLPDSSTGFSASDLDFVLWNWKTKKVMLIEIKTRGADIKKGQHTMWRLLNKWIKAGIDNDWNYAGFYLIQFQNSNFSDGKCFLNRCEISEENLIKVLSLC